MPATQPSRNTISVGVGGSKAAAIHHVNIPFINMPGHRPRQNGGKIASKRPATGQQPSKSVNVTSSKGGGKLKSATNKALKPRRKPGRLALMQIKQVQKKGTRLMKFAPLARAFRDALRDHGTNGMRVQAQAVYGLMYFVESQLIDSWSMCQFLAIHGKRITVIPKDCHLYNKMGLWKGMNHE